MASWLHLLLPLALLASSRGFVVGRGATVGPPRDRADLDDEDEDSDSNAADDSGRDDNGGEGGGGGGNAGASEESGSGVGNDATDTNVNFGKEPEGAQGTGKGTRFRRVSVVG